MSATIAAPAVAPTTDDDHNFRAGTQAHIVADSIAPSGVRLTTLDVVLHRYVLAEHNTHRTMCLAGGTELYFDLPNKVEQGRRSVHKMTVAEFHDKWHRGTRHARRKKGRFDLTAIDPNRIYTTKALAATIGAHGYTTIVGYCRSYGLPHHREGREYRILGRDFIEWYSNPPEVEYPLKERLRRMHLRCVDEDTNEFTWTSPVDVWESGEKDTYTVTLDNGKAITCSKDHQFYTDAGWLTLQELSGLTRSPSGVVSWNRDTPKLATNGTLAYKDPVWLQDRINEGYDSHEIAQACGVSVDKVKYQRNKHKLAPNRTAQRRRAGFTPWNKGRSYKNPKAANGREARAASARRGADHPWWKGGITDERALIGRWTQAQAPAVHKRNGYRCVVCSYGQDLRCHHVDPVARNPERARDETNLTTLCEHCHTGVHARNLEESFLAMFESGDDLTVFWEVHAEDRRPRPEWKPRPPGNPLVVRWASVTNIEYAGRQMTYDLEVRGPWHNFVADGIVVHNSRNSSSSRAIPVGKQVARVVNHPAMPVEWGVNRPGMQADEALDGELADVAGQVWLEARDAAVQAAQHLASLGVHKQVTNRLLEPFQWQRVLVTATDWFGFFAQRRHRDAQPEIRAAADAMFDAMAASTPAEVGYGGWHLPLVDAGELAELGQDVARKVSAARCARVSYMTHDGRRDVGKDLELFSRLADADPPHLSPLEHVASPVDPDRADWRRIPGNFQGWRQFRHEVYPDW